MPENLIDKINDFDLMLKGFLSMQENPDADERKVYACRVWNYWTDLSAEIVDDFNEQQSILRRKLNA